MTNQQKGLDELIRASLKRGDQTLIEDSWKSFRRMFVPRRASRHQVAFLREAFFSGAWMLFRLLTAGADDTGDPMEVTNWDEIFIARISRELDQFGQDLDRKYLKGRDKEMH